MCLWNDLDEIFPNAALMDLGSEDVLDPGCVRIIFVLRVMRCCCRRTSSINTGANGNGILIFLEVRFLRRNNNFNLEFDRACVRSFYDGATFHKVLKDTPPIRPKIQSASGMGGIF